MEKMHNSLVGRGGKVEIQKVRKVSAKKSKDENMADMQKGHCVNSGEEGICCENAEKWCKLYNEMKSSMKELEKELKEIKEVKKSLVSVSKTVNAQKTELAQNRFKTNLLTNVVIKHDEQLQEQSSKITNIQKRSMKYNLIISGLIEEKEESNQSLLWDIQKFIEEKLQVHDPIDIAVAHRFGVADSKGSRPVIIKVASEEQKRLLLAGGPKLRGVQNVKGQYYYISEQLPEELAEQKRYRQFWVRDNKRKPVDEQKDVSINQNRLYINNQMYRRKVSPPQNPEILRMNEEDLAEVRNVELIKGPTHEEKNSEFLTYVQQISSVNEVRLGYRKMRVRFADATHIMMAYKLPGAVGPLNQEGCDDGEHGSSRHLLQMLIDKDYTNVCVYVVRYYGGTHLGQKRFEIITNLAQEAIRKALRPRRPTTRSMSQAAQRQNPTNEEDTETEAENNENDTEINNEDDSIDEGSQSEDDPYTMAEDTLIGTPLPRQLQTAIESCSKSAENLQRKWDSTSYGKNFMTPATSLDNLAAGSATM